MSDLWFVSRFFDLLKRNLSELSDDFSRETLNEIRSELGLVKNKISTVLLGRGKLSSCLAVLDACLASVLVSLDDVTVRYLQERSLAMLYRKPASIH
jgi:hypothetical protein